MATTRISGKSGGRYSDAKTRDADVSQRALASQASTQKTQAKKSLSGHRSELDAAMKKALSQGGSPFFIGAAMMARK